MKNLVSPWRLGLRLQRCPVILLIVIGYQKLLRNQEIIVYEGGRFSFLIFRWFFFKRFPLWSWKHANPLTVDTFYEPRVESIHGKSSRLYKVASTSDHGLKLLKKLKLYFKSIILGQCLTFNYWSRTDSEDYWIEDMICRLTHNHTFFLNVHSLRMSHDFTNALLDAVPRRPDRKREELQNHLWSRVVTHNGLKDSTTMVSTVINLNRIF